MSVQSTRTQRLTLQPLLRIELFIASLLPVTGIFLIIVIGTKLLAPDLIGPFIAISLLCAIALFFAEFALISTMQRAIKGQFSDLIGICQTYMAGNREARAIIQGDAELTTVLAQALNSLLDFSTAQEKYYISRKTVSETNDEPVKKHVRQFVLDIAPAMNANLRAQTEKAVEDTGIIIDIGNYIAREFIQHIKLTHSVTRMIGETTGEVINRSIDLAQTSETLMLDFSQTTEKVEKLIAFMQRLSSVLQLYIESIQESAQTPFLVPNDDSSIEALVDAASISDQTILANDVPDTSKASVSQQTRLLQETLSSLQEQAIAAESIIEEFYNFAQGMHHSNTGVLNMVEGISSLMNLAEQLDNSTSVFPLSREDHQQHP